MFWAKKVNVIRMIFIVVCAYTFGACATTYRINTNPDNVSVYHKNGSEKAFLGSTPIDFEKSGLPHDKPFTLVFEKNGFEKKEMIVTPTDDTHTIISIELHQQAAGINDENLQRVSNILKKIFVIQEYLAKKRVVDALALINALEMEEPKLAEVFILKGSIYAMLEEKEEAKKNWEKALELDPNITGLRESIKNIDGGKQP